MKLAHFRTEFPDADKLDNGKLKDKSTATNGWISDAYKIRPTAESISGLYMRCNLHLRAAALN